MTRDFIEINDLLVLLEYADSHEEIKDICSFEEDIIAFAFYGSGNVDLSVEYVARMACGLSLAVATGPLLSGTPTTGTRLVSR